MLVPDSACEALSGAATEAAAEPFEPPLALQHAIAALGEGEEILRARDVYWTFCGPPSARPGYVEADFDGNGRPDYAVLLRAIKAKKVMEFNGRRRKLFDVRFVVFMVDGVGALEPTVIDTFEEFIPVGVVIELQPPGVILEWAAKNPVNLARPGVMRTFCGKSAVVAFWQDGRLREVWISD